MVWAYRQMVEQRGLLPRLSWRPNKRRFFLENSVWDAQKCLQHGVIDELVEDSELITKSHQLAKLYEFLGRTHTKEATRSTYLMFNQPLI